MKYQVGDQLYWRPSQPVRHAYFGDVPKPFDEGAVQVEQVGGRSGGLWRVYLVRHTDDGTQRFVEEHELSPLTAVGAMRAP